MSDPSTSDTPDALLHKLRAALVGEAHTDNDFTLRQMAVARLAGVSPRTSRMRVRKTHTPRHSLAWLAWTIARFSGWNCYYKPDCNHQKDRR